MQKTDSGLFVARNFNFLRHFGRAKGRERIVTDPRTGERMRVWTDDSRTTHQIEHDDSLDGVVTPDPIRLYLPTRAVRVRRRRQERRDAVARPDPIRTILNQ